MDTTTTFKDTLPVDSMHQRSATSHNIYCFKFSANN